ncbi:hypothetical protein N7490_011381 [Penicillium lividum]|nr:hypothetical protein N7490_011381 [Penicillium lividum]
MLTIDTPGRPWFTFSRVDFHQEQGGKNKEENSNLGPYFHFNNLTFGPPYMIMIMVMIIIPETLLEHGDTRSKIGSEHFSGAASQGYKRPSYIDGYPHSPGITGKVRMRISSQNSSMGTVDIVIGKVVGVHIKDEVLTGLSDILKNKSTR